jgi:hypothetical protein
MFCPKCGKQHDEGAVFCPQCGHALRAEATQSIPTPPTEPIQPKKSSKLGAILTYAVGGFVVLIFGLAIVGMLGDDQGEPQEQSTSSVAPTSNSDSATDAGDSESSEDLPGFGEGARTESGVEVYAISLNSSPSVPNEFVIDENDVKGQLVSIRFEVVNDSNEELSVSTGSFFGYIDAAEYEPLAVFSDGGEWYLYEPLGAGLGVTVDVFFDIPSGRSISGAKFQTSLFLGEEIEFKF